MTTNQAEIIENEWYIVRYSGETPEIAYNSAIYFLTRAKNGPHICLSEEQVSSLKKAAVDRYAEIVLRDLLHTNCNKPIYRGTHRSLVNYRRFCTFCTRQQVDGARLRSQAGEALVVFLKTEIEQVRSTKRLSIINSPYEELKSYAVELGVELPCGSDDLEELCPPPG